MEVFIQKPALKLTEFLEVQAEALLLMVVEEPILLEQEIPLLHLFLKEILEV